jgi:hypothetical protein
MPLHSTKVEVCCAVSELQIVGSILFQPTMNSDWYVSDISNPFFNRLIGEERRYGYFQEDNTIAHITDRSEAAVISKRL